MFSYLVKKYFNFPRGRGGIPIFKVHRNNPRNRPVALRGHVTNASFKR